jgi:hypothetical protein
MLGEAVVKGATVVVSRMWKLGTRRAMAYVEGAEIAQKVWEATGRTPEPTPPRKRIRGMEAHLRGAMAVYMDGKGRPFAWQIPFDAKHWDIVEALLS